jgi:hypothetical protein
VSWQQVRVVSDAEVYIVGTVIKSPDDEAVIWKWDGTTLTRVFESLTDGPWHTHWVDISWQGLWVARDGSEGWAFIHGDDVATAYEKFVRFNGTTWSHFQAVTTANKSADIAQIEGDTDSATASYSGAYGAFDNFNLPVNPGLWPDEYNYGSPPVENFRGIWYPTYSGAAAIDLIYTDAEPSAAMDYTRRSDETVTAVDTGTGFRPPDWHWRRDETITTVDWLVSSPPGYTPELTEAGGALPDETGTPDLGGQSQQERWTSPIQGAGLLQEDAPGSSADETEIPDIIGDSRQERWTSPIQGAGDEPRLDIGGAADASEIPELLGETQQERWTSPIQRAGTLAQAAPGGMPDNVAGSLVPPDYTEGFTDGDGNDFLGGGDIFDLSAIDATADSFGDPVAGNHWGGAKDGKFYADGVECGPGDFGTLAGGLRDSAWSFSGRDPMGMVLNGNAVTLAADDVIQFGGYKTSWNGDHAASVRRWCLPGDFDIQLNYQNWNPVSGESAFYLGVMENQGGTEGTNLFYIYRHTNGNYYAARVINNGWASLGSVAAVGTSGGFRITRSSGIFQAYYWSGSWVALGSTYSHANLNGDLFVEIQSQSNNAELNVQATNFQINSGTTLNRAGWYREASGSERGTQPDMPDNLVAVCTKDTLDLVDIDNDKLWMRFNKGANLALHNVDPYRPRRVRWDNGLLYLAFGSKPTEGNEGSGIIIDFTTEYIRLHRESASTVTGGFFAGSAMRARGCIALRNAAWGWGFDDNTWQTPQYRHFDVDIYRNGGYEYHVNATGAGMAMFKWQQGYLANNWGSVERSTSTETTSMVSCKVDPTTGELFYMDSTNLYSAFKGGGTGWEDAMDAGTFSADTTKALPGTRLYDYEYRFQIFNPYIFVVGYEGVYRVDWPSGSWELFYGKASRSDATHNILPEYDRATSIVLANDGGTNLLLIGLRWDAGSYVGDAPLPAQIVAVRLDTNVIWAIQEQALGERPRALAF